MDGTSAAAAFCGDGAAAGLVGCWGVGAAADFMGCAVAVAVPAVFGGAGFAAAGVLAWPGTKLLFASFAAISSCMLRPLPPALGAGAGAGVGAPGPVPEPSAAAACLFANFAAISSCMLSPLPPAFAGAGLPPAGCAGCPAGAAAAMFAINGALLSTVTVFLSFAPLAMSPSRPDTSAAGLAGCGVPCGGGGGGGGPAFFAGGGGGGGEVCAGGGSAAC